MRRAGAEAPAYIFSTNTVVSRAGQRVRSGTRLPLARWPQCAAAWFERKGVESRESGGASRYVALYYPLTLQPLTINSTIN